MSRPKTRTWKTLWLPRWLFLTGLWLSLLGVVLGGAGLGALLYYFSRQVPDYHVLADYKPSQITKFYAHDGQILAEYAKERRIYTPYSDIPSAVIAPFIATEDANFYTHWGFDPVAILRAFIVNITTDRTQGGSTITQQVAKNFLLSSERTLTRKIKELILAVRIEQVFSKEEILELYLNQIYLGNGAYGVAAAAQAYFGKQLEDLELPERALLAGLPKAPSTFNPVRFPDRSKSRRDIVLRRMEAEAFITAEEADEAIATPILLNTTNLTQATKASHFSEQVRRLLLAKYDEDTLYLGGMKIYTTLDLALQDYAEQSLYTGLRAYDRRHGWRGAEANWAMDPQGEPIANWREGLVERLQQEKSRRLFESRVGELAIVLAVDEEQATLLLPNEEEGRLPLAGLTWAKAYVSADEVSDAPETVLDVLQVGDLIYVRAEGEAYHLEQRPRVQGALVALDAQTGAVRAMVGGIGEGQGFNRAVQAVRQPGSVFKSFVYAYGLESGMTPATIVLDAPVVFRSGNKSWKPTNYVSRIYGPSTLRRGLESSRNLMTIRLAQELGMRNVVNKLGAFGLPTHRIDNPHDLTISLGSYGFTLLDLTSAYGVFPNQGKRVAPYYVSRVQDAAGNTVLRQHPCVNCAPFDTTYVEANLPTIENSGAPVVSPQVAFQMVSMLEGVVSRGTARRQLADLNLPLAGKTGTTNDYKDAWFIGFSPDLVVGVWVGFDTPETLGHGEAGGKVAAPIFGEFMQGALAGQPRQVFQVPDGISFVRIDQDKGTLPGFQTQRTLLEAFVVGSEPNPADASQMPGLEDGGVNSFGLF